MIFARPQLSYEDKLIAALGHPIRENRLFAIEALGNLRRQRALPHLSRILREDRTTTRICECVIPVERAKLSLLAWEIEESQHKSAWHWRPEAAGDEHTAWRCALLKFSGPTGFPPAPGFTTTRLMHWISLFLSLGVLFGALASATAYIIFYREYLHHFVDANKARMLALRGALTAFLFFLVLSVVAGYVITRFITPSG